VLLERLTERAREGENPPDPNEQLVNMGVTKTKSRTREKARATERRHEVRTMRAISKASCRISSFMSALLSWILCAAAAAADGGGGDPAPTGLRSSEEARSAACAAPPAPRLASSDILEGGWSGAAGHACPPSRGILSSLFLKGDGGGRLGEEEKQSRHRGRPRCSGICMYHCSLASSRRPESTEKLKVEIWASIYRSGPK
jgi:hypothetical protein